MDKKRSTMINKTEVVYSQAGIGIATVVVLILLAVPLSVSGQEKANLAQDTVKGIWKEFTVARGEGDLAKAEKLLTRILTLDPQDSQAWYYRGRIRFRRGSIKESVKDFDKHVALAPRYRSRQWERGIALYYADRFRDGADQFEEYQTYHDNDVENSVWRFLCVARDQNIEAARKNLLPIRNDRRGPMMQIYRMYQGKMTPQEVLNAAKSLAGTKAEKNSALFYANLYIGLLHEVQGNEEQARKHIRLAVEHRIDHYMWDVARVHLQLRMR